MKRALGLCLFVTLVLSVSAIGVKPQTKSIPDQREGTTCCSPHPVFSTGDWKESARLTYNDWVQTTLVPKMGSTNWPHRFLSATLVYKGNKAEIKIAAAATKAHIDLFVQPYKRTKMPD